MCYYLNVQFQGQRVNNDCHENPRHRKCCVVFTALSTVHSASLVYCRTKRWDLLYSRLKFLRRITFSTLLVKVPPPLVLNLVQNLKKEDNDEVPFQVIYKVPSYELFFLFNFRSDLTFMSSFAHKIITRLFVS